MTNLKELLLKQDKEVVTVEGIEFTIARMTVAARDAIKTRTEELKGVGLTEETATIIATVVAMCFKEDNLAFRDFTLEELQQIPYTFIAELFVQVSKVNKMSASDVEESKENFMKTP